uniref:Hypoxia-inducible factor 1 n=1 Tax=Palola sp. TaxID=3048018 RepID=A0AA96K9C9_9ANNE|nr:hypoxia-inducible factor 1 [Palola sp.]
MKMPSSGKPKRRNSEKRKEKSRDAARSRRGKETEVYYQLAHQLPLHYNNSTQLDKASIMRLAIAHLKLRKLLGPFRECRETALDKGMDQQYLKAMEGFLFIIGKEGDMMYLSENVTKYLGLSQVDLIGQSIYEFSHPCDHDEIREMLLEKPHHTEVNGEDRVFFVRLKCTLTNKGKSVNLKSAMYKVIRCSGQLITASDAPASMPGLKDDESLTCLMAIGEPIPHPSNIEIPLDSQTFLSRHSLDMKFTYCDDRITDLLGYLPDDLLGESAYDYHHALDSEEVEKAFRNLFSKGQTMTNKYRFLAKNGGFAWVVSQGTIIYNSRTEKPQCVVCVNFVISGVELTKTVMSNIQVKEKENEKPKGFVMSTDTIFHPRTKEHDEDFFRPPELKAKKTNVDDLTHLAPAVSEEMMPLCYGSSDHEEEIVTSKVNLFDDLMMTSSDSVSKPRTELPAPSPAKKPLPFMISLRDDDILDDVGQLGSPITSASSTPSPRPSTSFAASNVNQSNKVSIPQEVDALDLVDDDEPSPSSRVRFTTDFMDEDSVQDINLEMRAPYIPMSGDEDLIFSAVPIPLVDSDEGGNRLMLGITETIFNPKPADTTKATTQTPVSILKMEHAGLKPRLPVGDLARNAGPPKMKRPMETNRLETGPPAAKVARVEVGTSGTPTPTSTMTAAANPPSQSLVNNNQGQTAGAGSSGQNRGSSVLMNLLTKGEDTNYGYSVNKPFTRPSQPPTNSSQVGPSISTQEMLMSPTVTSTTQGQLSILQRLISSDEPSESNGAATTSLLRKLLPRITQFEAEVNVPVQDNSNLLQGAELLKALEIGGINLIPFP